MGKQVLDLGRSHQVADLRGFVADARALLERMGLALVLNAHLVVLDEPTTALDMIHAGEHPGPRP